MAFNVPNNNWLLLLYILATGKWLVAPLVTAASKQKMAVKGKGKPKGKEKGQELRSRGKELANRQAGRLAGSFISLKRSLMSTNIKKQITK